MKVKHRALLGTAFSQVADIDIRLLRVFKTVVECGGMTSAELELNINGSTISRHIKDLETRLRLTLCRRGRAGFALTAEGERIYRETLQLLAAIDDFRANVDDIHQRMGGQLSIAVFDKTASNPAAHLGDAIARFSDRAPDVALALHVAPLNAIERGVIDGEFQVGIIPTHRPSDSLLYYPLFDETMCLYCAASHRWFDAQATPDWDDLRHEPFAGLGYHSPNMQLSHAFRLSRKATAFDQEAIATLILSGRYVGFLPEHYAEGFVQAGRMQVVNPALFQYTAHFTAILRRSPQASRATREFVDCLTLAHRAP